MVASQRSGQSSDHKVMLMLPDPTGPGRADTRGGLLASAEPGLAALARDVIAGRGWKRITLDIRDAASGDVLLDQDLGCAATSTGPRSICS
ncbi:MAG: hypothetical protein R3D84_03505 [Paracoccaceae bacterium]